MESNNFASAIECLNEAISINPHNSNIFLARASCYKSIQMFAEAYFDYSFLIKLEPLNGKVSNFLLIVIYVLNVIFICLHALIQGPSGSVGLSFASEKVPFRS